MNTWQASNYGEVSERLTNVMVPTVISSSVLLNGINASTAALRGWLLVKEESLKQERKAYWKAEIRPALNEMTRLSKDWTNPENVARLDQVSELLAHLEAAQQQVEQFSTDEESQAIALLEHKVLPIVSDIRLILDDMVESQKALMQSDVLLANDSLVRLVQIGWGLLAGGIILSAILSLIITRSVTGPIGSAVRVAQEIGSGNLHADVDLRGTRELENLGASLLAMRDSLQMKDLETKQFEWATTGQNKLYEVMRGEKSANDLIGEVIAFVAEYTGCDVGAAYLLNDNETNFQVAGKYALSTENLTSFRLGEGFLGQVAADQTVKLLELDEEHLLIKSSTVIARPMHVLVVPFLYENRTLGVLELASFQPLSQETVRFVKSILESIGIAVYSSISQTRVKQLLEETQQQSEELQQQQHELEQTNVELEEQTHKLKEQQEELQAANEELEEQTQVVEQKNSDLETARADIEMKAKQLEITSKYKSEFLANMSHELRTPLNSLLILSNDLVANKENNLIPDQIESAQIITKSGYDLLNLINEILDLSKIESGKMELNLGEIRVNDLADDLVRNFKKTAEEKNLELKAIVEDGMPASFRSDRQRVDQVLKNLLSNALKFTSQGAVTLRFRCNSGGYLEIAVEDSGIGIPEDKQQLIFEAFQQA
ncbi:MAG: ATP-binding protein, partial [Marinoscillum sp.]